MQTQSTIKKAYYTYLGLIFSFAYHTRWRRFLSFAISSWFKFFTLVLFFTALILSWSTLAVGILGLLIFWIYFSYWRIEKLGFKRFIVDETIIPPPKSVPTIQNGKRIPLYATGIYSLANRAETVLLRPGEYWRSAIGEHGVMVNHYAKKYVYQFFRAETLEAVQGGWLIFGKNPMHTLAITFGETWGPDHADNVPTYMARGDEKKNTKLKKRTIYLTFEDTAVQNEVWQTILADLHSD